MKEAFDRKTFSILIPNGTVFAAVTIADLEAICKVTLLALTIAYTVWKWKREAKRKDT